MLMNSKFSLVQTSLTNFRLICPTACPAIPLGFLADSSNLTCLKLKSLPEMYSIHSVLYHGSCQLLTFYCSDLKSWVSFDSSPSRGLSLVDPIGSDFKIYRESNQIWKNSNSTTATQVQVEIISHLDYNNGLLTWIIVLTRGNSYLSQKWSGYYVSIIFVTLNCCGLPHIRGLWNFWRSDIFILCSEWTAP